MKKAFLILLVVAMLATPVLSVAAGEPSESTGNVYDVFVDFNTVTDLVATKYNNITVGLQETLSMSSESKLVKDGDSQVLYFPKTNTATYGGINFSGVTTGASNYVFLTVTVKVANLSKEAAVNFAYIGGKWVYGWAIVGTESGKPELVCDVVMNNKASEPAAWTEKTTLAVLESDRYYTITAKFDLVNQTQSIYLDGKELSSGKAFRDLSTEYNKEVTKITTPTRLKLFYMYQGTYECYFKNLGLYSSQTIETPYEYVVPESELDIYKKSAKGELEATVPDLSAYRDAQKTEIETILTEGKAAIDAAADADAAKAALAAAKAKLLAVKTNAQLTAEESLVASKAAAKTALASVVVLSDYSEANQTAINALLAKANEDIDAQTTEDGVSKIVTSTKNKLLDFKTAAEEALEAKKEEAIEALESFVDLTKLDAAVKASVEDAIEDGIIAIEEAEDTAAVDAALTAAKAAINALLPQETTPVTDAPTEEKKGGCGASVTLGAILLPLAAMGVLLKKKED